MEGETVDVWFARYHAAKIAAGHSPTIGQWRLWISPRIGHMHMRDVMPDDVERIRDVLDEAIVGWHAHGPKEGERVSGVTACAIWWLLVGAFRAARASKRRDLRVLAGLPSPCDGIESPGDARTRRPRRKTFVYPAEAENLFACERITIAWREAHAIASYTYLRPGELRVLQWRDVDLDRARLRVWRAWSPLTRTEKPPKTPNGVRDVPIAPTLLPLLARMRRGAREDDLVVPIITTRASETLAWRTREHLRLAGASRDALHVTTRTTVRANWRSWRDSGITWLAMAGLGVAQIMRRAGHEDVATTMGYVKLAEDPGRELGEPFGPLPQDLVDGRGYDLASPAWCRRSAPLKSLVATNAKSPATSREVAGIRHEGFIVACHEARQPVDG